MPHEGTEQVARLFAQEVPKIAAGVVTIKAIARKLGSRTKLAVPSDGPPVDGIAVCICERGGRLARIVDQLNKERIDLFRWGYSPAQLIANVLQPAQVKVVVLHREQARR